MHPIFTITALGATIMSSGEREVSAAEVADEVREVGAFDGLAVDGSLTLELSQGTPTSLVVSGPAGARAKVKTLVEDGTLRVSGGGEGVTVRVTMPSLRSVSIAGSGRVGGEGTWKAQRLSAAISGSGWLALTVEAQHLEVAIAGSGKVSLGGAARRAEVAIQGSGSVELGVEERLAVAIAGSGSVRYRGPESVEVEVATSGSGRVQRAQ